jgi:hypothetical protein
VVKVTSFIKKQETRSVAAYKDNRDISTFTRELHLTEHSLRDRKER